MSEYDSLEVSVQQSIVFIGGSMIRLTRLNHVPLLLNSDLIEQVEVTPDTVITMTTGEKHMVLESAEEIVDRVVEFRRTILNWATARSDENQAGASRLGPEGNKSTNGKG
jgi:flagellar protein FlbD